MATRAASRVVIAISRTPNPLWLYRHHRRGLEAGRRLVPGTASFGLLIAVLVERVHIDLVEFAGLGGFEIHPDIGEVVVDAVPLGDEVSAQHVVLSARRQHRVDGAARDRDGAPFARAVVRIERGIADDVGVPYPTNAALG